MAFIKARQSAEILSTFFAKQAWTADLLKVAISGLQTTLASAMQAALLGSAWTRAGVLKARTAARERQSFMEISLE